MIKLFTANPDHGRAIYMNRRVFVYMANHTLSQIPEFFVYIHIINFCIVYIVYASFLLWK